MSEDSPLLLFYGMTHELEFGWQRARQNFKGSRILVYLQPMETRAGQELSVSAARLTDLVVQSTPARPVHQLQETVSHMSLALQQTIGCHVSVSLDARTLHEEASVNIERAKL